MKIKCQFPYNYYLLRKVKIYKNGKLCNKIGHREEVEIEVKEDDELRFKLDYFRKILIVNHENIDKNIMIFFRFRDYFPQLYIDFCSRSALQAKFLDSTEFKNIEETIYKDLSKPSNYKYDIISVVTAFVICLSLIIIPILLVQVKEISETAFIFGVIGIINLVTMLADKKNMHPKSYRLRLILVGLIGAPLFYFLVLPYHIKYVLFALVILVVIRVLSQKETTKQVVS